MSQRFKQNPTILIFTILTIAIGGIAGGFFFGLGGIGAERILDQVENALTEEETQLEPYPEDNFQGTPENPEPIPEPQLLSQTGQTVGEAWWRITTNFEGGTRDVRVEGRSPIILAEEQAQFQIGDKTIQSLELELLFNLNPGWNADSLLADVKITTSTGTILKERLVSIDGAIPKFSYPLDELPAQDTTLIIRGYLELIVWNTQGQRFAAFDILNELRYDLQVVNNNIIPGSISTEPERSQVGTDSEREVELIAGIFVPNPTQNTGQEINWVKVSYCLGTFDGVVNGVLVCNGGQAGIAATSVDEKDLDQFIADIESAGYEVAKIG